jgi:hypothetical protein
MFMICSYLLEYLFPLYHLISCVTLTKVFGSKLDTFKIGNIEQQTVPGIRLRKSLSEVPTNPLLLKSCNTSRRSLYLTSKIRI